MSAPHRIRLIGPWDVGRDKQSERVRLPRDWSQVIASCGRTELRLRRRFHRPTGLDDSTRVFVVMPEPWRSCSVALNGETLTESSPANGLRRFDITGQIGARESHELQIVLDSGSAAAALFLVAIEIEAR